MIQEVNSAGAGGNVPETPCQGSPLLRCKKSLDSKPPQAGTSVAWRIEFVAVFRSPYDPNVWVTRAEFDQQVADAIKERKHAFSSAHGHQLVINPTADQFGYFQEEGKNGRTPYQFRNGTWCRVFRRRVSRDCDGWEYRIQTGDLPTVKEVCPSC